MIRMRCTIAAAIATATFVFNAQAQEPPPSLPASPQPAPETPTIPTTTDGPVHAQSEAPGPEGAPDANAKPALPEWMKGVTLGGGVILWWYQPVGLDGAKNNVSVFFANLRLDGKWGIFGLHLEPRFRDSKLRAFFDGPAWLQEAYASVDLGAARIRVGKTYSRLGLFWDNSFYGNVQVYDGLKLDPDYGISIDGDVGTKDDVVSLGWWAQYFVVDGGTNVSLAGRDTISIPGARRRNMAIARAEPRLRFGDVTVTAAASGEYFQADLPVIGDQDVWRGGADAKLTFRGLGVWGEYLHQSGMSVTGFPYPALEATPTSPASAGRSSTKVDYALAGVEYTIGPVTGRYNISFGHYSDVSVKETMHVPAVGIAISPNVSALGELVIWRRSTPEGASFVDRSFNLTINAHL